ncbi:MAG: type II toxin-antitoxin system mRNA interferase toxin, RelE/StbE family [Saccharofermentans sp.]|nr:type II toxin-antitoxin system mRNA interferase toxin, RelE/StbE family [Saccharofermentans sp.]
MDNESLYAYEILYTKAADKFFVKHEDVRRKYVDNIKKLLTGEDPENLDIKMIKGTWNNYYRMRIGSYRVIYTVIRGKLVVINTIAAGPRGDEYKKKGGIK